MKDKQVVPVSFYENPIQYISPSHDYIESKAVVNEIKNAWKDSCILDKTGNLWVKDSHLNSILRTSKSNAKYYVQQIRKEYKTTKKI